MTDKTDETMEHMWVECKGNICRKSYLIGGLYQSSSDEREKLIWITLSNHQYLGKTIAVTGETIINCVKPSVDLTWYKYMKYKSEI